MTKNPLADGCNPIYLCFRYSIENSYLEEKEDACNAIREIAENVGELFYPYLDECYQQVNILTEVRIRD